MPFAFTLRIEDSRLGSRKSSISGRFLRGAKGDFDRFTAYRESQHSRREFLGVAIIMVGRHITTLA